MKIVYFHQHFSTPRGSVGIRSYEMARRLIARGNEVLIVCGSYSGGETGLTQPFINGQRRGTIEGIEIIELDLAYSNADSFYRRCMTFVKFALQSVAIALSEKYDVIFATTTPLTAGIPGIFARWLRGKHFVFEVRDLWPELPRAMGVIRNPLVLWVMSALEWVSYHSAHRLIGLSPGIVAGISDRGIPNNRILMIPNGCDLDIFSATEESWRPQGVLATDLLAIFAGTHGIANGLNVVLDVALELKYRSRDDIKILLIGQGKLKADLQARVLKQKLNNVIFHDPVNKRRLAGLMVNVDLGLQILANVKSFYFGTSPNKFFDYIAAGLPVLNNYPGWLAELITEHHCGFVVPPDNPIAFANALEDASKNREMLKDMGKRARLLAELKFGRIKLADQWVDWVTGVKS